MLFNLFVYFFFLLSNRPLSLLSTRQSASSHGVSVGLYVEPRMHWNCSHVRNAVSICAHHTSYEWFRHHCLCMSRFHCCFFILFKQAFYFCVCSSGLASHRNALAGVGATVAAQWLDRLLLIKRQILLSDMFNWKGKYNDYMIVTLFWACVKGTLRSIPASSH